MIQILNLRDSLISDDSERLAFDEAYKPLLDNFRELTITLRNLKTLCDRHLKDVKEGTAVVVHHGRQISVLHPVDDEYRALFKEFFIKGEMIISAIPRVARVLGLRLGFFFGDKNKFEKESDQLRKSWGKLADFVIPVVEGARSTWYKRFNQIRNDIEHGSIKIPYIEYQINSSSAVDVIFPIDKNGSDLLQLLDNLTNRIFELVEECIVFILATRLKSWQFIKDIPQKERNPDNVIRYKLYARIGGKEIPFGN
jgi:hypothetical protein